VLKPLGGISSIGVRKIEALADVEEVLASEAGVGADPADRRMRANQGWLIEEYIDGRLLSVDGLIRGGEVLAAEAMCEFVLGPEPLFIEEGVRVPARISAAERAACLAYTERVIAALGMDECGFHCELRLGERGPALVEIAGRMPGQALVYEAATGLNFGAALADLWLGRPVEVPQETRAHVIGGAVLAPAAGRLTRLDGVDAVAGLDGIWFAEATTAVGDHVNAYPDEPTALAVYAGAAPTPEAADALVAAVEEVVQADVEPDPGADG
jgi:biotin carboxylase